MSDGKQLPHQPLYEDRGEDGTGEQAEDGAVEPASEQPRQELVLKLLADDTPDTLGLELDLCLELDRELDYDLDAWHLGLVATGAGAERAVRGLADALGQTLLLVRSPEQTLWAWLGGQQKLAGTHLEPRLSVANATLDATPDAVLAIGETRHGLEGWRTTHREAQVALPVARHRPGKLTRCSDFLLEAIALSDEVAMRTLQADYLQPLEDLREAGLPAHETLRAYLACNRNLRASATAIGASPQTIQERLGAIETRLGRPLASCHAELDVALRLHALDPRAHAAPLSSSSLPCTNSPARSGPRNGASTI